MIAAALSLRNLPSARVYGQAIDSLTVALPAAESGSAKVGVRIFGDRDLGRGWASTVSAAWIPVKDRQERDADFRLETFNNLRKPYVSPEPLSR